MAKINVSLDAELVVRDYIARGHRTEARAELRDQSLHEVEIKPQDPQG
ncbi:DUF2191 domain-containing protein [Streptomyces cavernae]